jgi:K+-sensing histidine kinase KdpD
MLEQTNIDAGWMGLFEPGEDSLSLVANRGLSETTIGELIAAGIHRPDRRRAIRSGEPTVMTVALSESDLGHGDSDRRVPSTLVGAPIRARGDLLGALGGLFCRESGVSTQDIQLLVAIGNQIGVAVENVRLLEEASEIEVFRELDRLRSELVATASHELRTPLGLVRIFATALLMEEAALDLETQRKFLVAIADETDKLENIIDNLLDLSRMESGHLLLTRRPTDIVQLVKAALASMEPELDGHRLVADLPSGSMVAKVDPGRVEQVLRNLLSNAVKYSPDGGTITVRGRSTPEQVRISVRDQGIGIPPEECDRIFERFYRVENDVTRRTRGAGLGLSICKWIVEAHDGQIRVQSEPGRGSEFRVDLPIES